MEHRNTGIENRKYPRIKKRLQFKIRTDDFVVVTESINLSCIGVSCQIKDKIPFMTRLKIVLRLPCSDEKKEDICVECYGVVVRVEKVLSKSRGITEYHIAIFFSEIEEEEREKLSDYIQENGNM
ncbi:MAG: PilZ domain-containing protein [Candidatus Scalindua sp. SCAELEC01]|nr:PilZ domain-containing protein [Planctomycetota bacterium]RZV91409.1 MAG: PilZ domain-containing protein [Candidatus Scalindua sp. SCAELEC01]